MELASPTALWFLLAVPLLLLLELLGRRRRDVVVSSLMLWSGFASSPNVSRRALLPRSMFSTALRLLAVTAAALAAAGPRLPSEKSVPQFLFVLDISASMQTLVSEGTSRFDLARRDAEQVARDLPSDAEIVVQTLPVLAAPRSVRPPAIGSALAQLEPTDLPLRFESALDDVLTQGPSSRRAWVFTAAPGPPRPGVQYVAAQGVAPNAGITSLVVEERGGSEARLFARIVSYGASTELEVQVHTSGAPTIRVPLNLAADESRLVATDLPSDEAEVVEVSISRGGALGGDDRAFAMRRIRRPSVLMVGDLDPSVLRALAAVGAETVERAPASSEDALDPEGFDVLVTSGQPSAAVPITLVVSPVPGGPVGRPIAVPMGSLRRGTDDELLSSVDLSGVIVRDVYSWTGSTSRVVAYASSPAGDVPAIVRRNREIWILFDLEASDWPRHPSFPIFFARLVEEAQGARLREFDVVRTGERCELPLGTIEVIDPRGRPHDVFEGETLPYFVPELVGKHRCGQTDLFVSLLSQSDSARIGEAPAQANETPLEEPGITEREGTDLSPHLAALALLSVLAVIIMAK